MRIGARTLKTGIAIFLSLVIPYLLGYPDMAALSGISAIFSLQQSVKRSFTVVKDRVFANTLGGIIAVFVVMTIGNSFFTVALAASVLIAMLHQLNLDRVIGLASVTLIIIMLADQDQIVVEAFVRVLSTIVGVVVTFIVNSLVFPPKYEARLLLKIENNTADLTKYTRASLRKNAQFSIFRSDLSSIRKEIRSQEQMLILLIDQNSFWFFKKAYADLREVVVYRQFIQVSRSLLHLSTKLLQSENVYNHFPKEIRIIIRERVETLMSAHEQILMKFNGRIRPNDVNFIAYKASLRKTFMGAFFTEASLEAYQRDDYGQSNTVIHLMSAILEYEEELQQLDKLIRSYIKHHPEVYKAKTIIEVETDYSDLDS